jgi:hypothetical protein
MVLVGCLVKDFSEIEPSSNLYSKYSMTTTHGSLD